MKRQRILSQTKDQDKTLEKQLNEVNIATLPEKGVRIMISEDDPDLGGKKGEEMFNKDLKNDRTNKQR